MSSELVTTHHDRHLSGDSRRSSDVGSLVEANYDYMLVGSSWDRRCLALTAATTSVGLAQLFLPSNTGSSGRRTLHDAELSSYVIASAESVEVIDQPSEDLEEVFDRLETSIVSQRKSLDRPLRMIVDLSAMPRYFTLGVVALALNNSVAEFVDVIYAEGIYGSVLGTSPVAAREFSSSWEAVAVPRLEGDWYPSHQRHFLISVGFEAAQVARLVDRWDPDRISVLFPRPAALADYESHTTEQNLQWMRQFAVGEDAVIDGSPLDAIAVWREMSASGIVNPMADNVYCLLCGSKPHGLGLAMYALARERPAVMYVRPTVHEEKDISPNGIYWRYRLRDRTLIHESVADG